MLFISCSLKPSEFGGCIYIILTFDCAQMLNETQYQTLHHNAKLHRALHACITTHNVFSVDRLRQLLILQTVKRQGLR
ncbi:hypothetical protein HanIR_Chr05g0234801 [Helianthus annuus]|nr:hypothetical protein HanIR_Chr05g0234801 [Helianthus annuus]